MRSLTLKLILAFSVTLAIQALLVAFLVRDANRKSLDKFVLEDALQIFVADVTSHYQAENSWQGVQESLGIHRNGPGPPHPGAGHTGNRRGPGPGKRPPENRKNKPPPPRSNGMSSKAQIIHFGLADASGRVVFGAQNWAPGAVLSEKEKASSIPIAVDGQVVGNVLLPTTKIPLSTEAQSFLASTDRALLFALFAALSIALLLGFWFTRTSLKPVKALTAASEALATGKSLSPLEVHSQDEIGVLTEAFNNMSAALSKSEQVRKNMTADIAHELRTPLTVLTGYLEAIKDGDLNPSPERIETLLEESRHLQRLVDDLRMLSLADAGELPLFKEPLNPVEITQSILSMFANQAERKGITLLSSNNISAPKPLHADAGRLQQVLKNLVSNAIRFAPTGGTISLDVTQSSTHTTLRVSDNGPGIPEADVPFVFERFYKVDKSRQNHLETTGMGLAISKSIVDAHDGIISVSSIPDQETCFTITLPNE